MSLSSSEQLYNFENSTPPQLLSTSDAFGSVVANDVITPIRQRSVSSSTFLPCTLLRSFMIYGKNPEDIIANTKLG